MDGTLIARASGYFLFDLTYENAKKIPEKKGHIPMPSRRSDGRFQSLGRFAFCLKRESLQLCGHNFVLLFFQMQVMLPDTYL
jgi:hypothetical protein